MQLDMFCVVQGSHSHGKTWKVMKLYNLVSRPVKSWNSNVGHGKSQKIMFIVQNH